MAQITFHWKKHFNMDLESVNHRTSHNNWHPTEKGSWTGVAV
jgi:hypothetical protein